MYYVDILLPVAVPQAFTYSVPDGMEVREGMLVRVPFGKRKVCEGLVCRRHESVPLGGGREPKAILEPVDRRPVVRDEQLRLWEWVASYYLCTVGEVMKAALPGGIRDWSYRPTAELYVRLTEGYRSAERVAETLEEIRRAKVQCQALLAYLAGLPTDVEGEPLLQTEDADRLWVERAEITDSGIAAAAVLKLVERGILEQREIVPSDLGRKSIATQAKETVGSASLPDSGEESPDANPVETLFESFRTVLLSGEIADTQRTTIPLYTALAAREIDRGNQTLLLLPDTVMTTQVTNALQATFGPRCLFYHSRLTDRARSAAYRRMVEEPESVGLVVGTRSALFLPFRRLGLVVVDNEHDPNYRQSDRAPRYHARDTALMLAHLHGARTLLASPTPSMESWLNATTEGAKYGFLSLPPCGTTRAEVTVLERGKGLISKYLQRRIDETLRAGRQVVLFQNRRGFAPYVECAGCGAKPTCPHCNVTLTYHKESSALACHYCGWSQPYTSTCPACGMQTLTPRGIGTERIEEEAAELFPTARIARMDTDTTRGAGALGRLLTELAEGETGILVGTRMVVRTAQAGEHIGLVGVINADNLLAHPDFRAAERAFQLLMQLKALLPTGQEAGELVIQSSQRTHPVLIAVANHDAAGFYRHETEERAALNYPPYVRMLRLTFRHRDKLLTAAAAAMCEALLRERFGRRVSPPFEPQVDRVQNLFILHLLLRIERQRPVARAKAILLEVLARVRKRFSTVYIMAEADPQQ
ncbi:MAG: primosomal protein N' [Rikenella sp.]|nr:primosomal protein N' [Rikenella sp.]